MQSPPIRASQRRATAQCRVTESAVDRQFVNNTGSTCSARDGGSDGDSGTDTAEWQRHSSALPLSACSAPESVREHHARARVLSPSRTAALPMKKSRLQHALGDAVQLHSHGVATTQNNSEIAHADAETSEVLLQQVYTRQVRQQQVALATSPSTTLSAFSDFASPEQIAIARDAMERTVANVRVAPATDRPSFDRVLQALQTELSRSIENPAKRLEPDARCWYTFGNVVGKGTFGRVTRARHRLSDTPVAIKSYYRERGATVCCPAPSSAVTGRHTLRLKTDDLDALDWRRVRHEVKMMATLKPHVSVIRFIEAFETPTQMHVVMEYVTGETLCDFMHNQQRQQRSSSRNSRESTFKLNEATARGIFVQLVNAVASLHDQDVIHRDLKLENVLVDKRGDIKLIDFGFSQFDSTSTVSRSRTGPVTIASSTTLSARSTLKNFCGTPSYMAPEVVTSKHYDGKCVDVWSLGVVLYVLLCGKFPFEGASFQQLYQRIRMTSCAFVGADRSVSADAQALVRSVLVVDPTKRPRVRDLLTHPWLTSAAHARPMHDDARFISAFRQSNELLMRVCAALEIACGVCAVALMDAVRCERVNGATTLVRLVALAAEQQYSVALAECATRPISSRHCSSDNNSDNSESIELHTVDSMSHRQRLEDLIGLVKASLTV